MAQQPKDTFFILRVDPDGRLAADPDAAAELGLQPGRRFVAVVADDGRIVLTRVLTPEEALSHPDLQDWDEWEEADDDPAGRDDPSAG